MWMLIQHSSMEIEKITKHKTVAGFQEKIRNSYFQNTEEML
jgi:hypothetical protein